MQIWVILVNGNISKDGYFVEAELDVARELLKSYQHNYKAVLKAILPYNTDTADCQRPYPESSCGC